MILVGSPAALPPTGSLDTVDDIEKYPLLSSRLRAQDWKLWFRAAGRREPPHERQLLLESRKLIIQAAINGLGLAVVDPIMISDELQTGSLVQALPIVT